MNKTTESDSYYDSLEQMSTVNLLANINKEDKMVALIVEKQIPQIEKYLNQLANGTTFQELYLDDLAEIEVFVPELKEQNKISNFLNRLESVYNTSVSINSNKILKNGFHKSNDEFYKLINLLRRQLIFAVIQIDDVIKKIR